MPDNRPDPRDLLAVAVAVVRPAAERVRRMRAVAVGDVTTKSTDTDVVTLADREVEREMVAALRRARPHDTVLGEEYGAGGATGPGRGAAAATVRWLLDPIDGTVNYLYGLPFYAVSLAAEVDGEVVAGVVCNAATGQEWTAVTGQGAYRSAPTPRPQRGSAPPRHPATRPQRGSAPPRHPLPGAPGGGARLRGSTQTRLGQALVATGFSYEPVRRADQARVLVGLLPRVRDIRRLGSAALDLCLAAEGTVDAFFERGLNLWDHAAGGLVAVEAGLTVAGLGGAAAGSRMLVAAPPALFDPLHDLLVDLDAAGP